MSLQLDVYERRARALAQSVTSEIKAETGYLSKVTIEIIPHQVHSTLQLDARATIVK